MIYQIRVLTTGQNYKIDTLDELAQGQDVLVDAEQILEPAKVLCSKCPKRDIDSLPMCGYVRVMTKDDHEKVRVLKDKALSFLGGAQDKVMRHLLDMKIIKVDLSFDEKKLTFYFSAGSRIDFRALVSDMVGSYRKIIRLQQIGPREETGLIGGYGKCGQELCCHRFLKDLDGVSGELSGAEVRNGQKLSKLTGCCGRLMCCLTYDKDIQDGVTK